MQTTNLGSTERPSRGWLEWSLLVLSTLVLMAGLLVLAGWIGGDVRSWSTWLSWVPAPVASVMVLFGLLLASGVSGHTGRVVRGGHLLLLVFFASWTFGIDLGLHRSRSVAPDDLDLVHWNATWPGKAAPIAPAYERLALTDPDLLIVTEPGTFGWGRAGRSFSARWPHVMRSSGLAVLSRHPLLEVRPVLRADQLSLFLVRVALDGGERVVWVVDLPSDPRRSRSEVFDTLLRGAREQGLPEPDLVIGDFNVARHSRALGEAFPAHRNAFDVAGSGWSGTWPRLCPLWQLDQVLVGPDVGVRHYEVIDPGVGQHRMQRVVLRVDDGGLEAGGRGGPRPEVPAEPGDQSSPRDEKTPQA